MLGLCYIRKQNFMTLSVLAKKVGVSKQTVSKWESGKIKQISEDKLKQLAEMFDVEQEYLTKEIHSELKIMNSENIKQNINELNVIDRIKKVLNKDNIKLFEDLLNTLEG